MKMFFVAGIGLAVFIEFLLISKKSKSESDKILTMWMFLIILHLFTFYLFFTGDAYEFPFLLGIEHPLPLLHGVFLYYYVCYVTKQLPERRSLLFLHLLPAALMYAWLSPFFILPAEQKIQIYRNKGAGYETFGLVKSWAITFSGLVYVAWSALLLRRHRKNIRESFSDLHKVSLRWLQILTYGLGGIWILVILFRSDMLTFSGVVLFVFLIGFLGVRQGDIFGQNPPVPAEEEDGEQKKKYTKSGLSDEVSEELHRSLIALMAEEEPYKKSDLSINDLSSKLGVHPNYLSQVINQREGKNFYDFVNGYRIEEFKRLIQTNKNQQFTLLSLAFDCGFSSKSSFNRCFKKATGQTPSEFSASLSRA